MLATYTDCAVPEDLVLPRYPKIVEALDREIQQNADIKTISDLVGKDPYMSKVVLRIINSSFYGMRNSIASVHHAVSLLGAEKIKILVLTPTLKSALMLESDLAGYLWRRSVLSALCARKLSNIVEGVMPDEAYIAGMFQNTGCMILHKNYDDYVSIYSGALEKKQPVYIAEYNQYHTSNLAVAYAFVKKWTMPESVSSAVLYQYSNSYRIIEDSNIRGLIAIMTLTNQIVNEVMYEHGEKYIWDLKKYCARAMEELAVNDDDFSEVGTEIKADLYDELNNLELM